jgi:oxaloacetate decarboxylase beta subunit
MLMFGNILRETGVVERLSQSAQNELININTIFLGLAVGSTMVAEVFFQLLTVAVFILGLVAFSVGAAGGVMMGKVLYWVSGGKINPLVGAAGVSAVPMAARVVNQVGLQARPDNYLLMHALSPNVAGVIGSAIAAGVILSFFQ